MDKDLKKRKRTSLVCEPCRKKKIKCDKKQPCTPCLKSKKSHCTYDPEALDVFKKSDEVLPYMSSAKNPLTFNSETSKQPKRDSSVEQSDTDNGSRSEIELLKEKLSMLENTLQQQNRPEIIPAYSTRLEHMKIFPNENRSLPAYDFQLFSTPNIPQPTLPHPEFGKFSNQYGQYSGIQGYYPPNGASNGFPNPNQFSGLTPGSLPSIASTSTYSQSRGDSFKSDPFSPMNPVNGYSSVRDSSVKPSDESKTFQAPAGYLNDKAFNTFIDDNLTSYNPYGSPEDTISFFEGYSSVHIKEDLRRVSFGPFSWSSLMLKDQGLKLLWDYTVKMEVTNAKTALIFVPSDQELNVENSKVLTSTTTESAIDLDEKVFEKRLLQPEGIEDVMPYNMIKQQVEENLQKAANNQSTLPLGLAFVNSNLDSELRLIDRINLFLPKQRVIWKLIHIFFSDCYPFMPFLDEKFFREEISKIIGAAGCEDEKIKGVVIEKRLDFAHVGILLIILRLAYLSLFTNRNDINERRLNSNDFDDIMGPKTYKYLLSNPITMNIIDVAQECLDQFNIFRNPSIPVLQLTYYMKIYHTYAPEDGDGADGGDSSSMLAIIIQMATSLGFNRDPDTYTDRNGAPKPLNSLIRRIWHHLLLNDVHTTYAFGSNILVNKGSYDTKLPEVKEGELCLADAKLDRFIVESINKSHKVYSSFKNMLEKMLDVNNPPKMSEICPMLSNLETTVKFQYGSLADCIAPTTEEFNHFNRSFKTKFFLSLKAFLVGVYFYFYLYYEPKNFGLSFFYLKKLLLVAVGEVMPFYGTFIGNIRCDMFINPTFEQFIHKSNQVFIALLIKLNFVIYTMKIKADHESRCQNDPKYLKYYKALCRTSSCITRCLEVSISAIAKISNRYYYAWRITKGHTALLRLITKKEFYRDNLTKAGSLATAVYSVEQLEEIINLCEASLKRVQYFESIEKSQADTPYADTPGVIKPPTSNENVPTNPPTVEDKSESMPNSVLSTDSDDSLGKFNLDVLEDAEVDKIWLELLSSKIENVEPSINLDIFNNTTLEKLFE
ncbi:multidrug resistance regulator 1 [[Candida] jaroonii]|uniref:Multidrug resistance regulator 1 n=1 Tax=[Candida] jaroonii TaxID=467808 RepID=A0ACA9Y1P2_9ASCO|nr:multidrug resistance regulator 1 [[Candida] jaroonii]